MKKKKKQQKWSSRVLKQCSFFTTVFFSVSLNLTKLQFQLLFIRLNNCVLVWSEVNYNEIPSQLRRSLSFALQTTRTSMSCQCLGASKIISSTYRLSKVKKLIQNSRQSTSYRYEFRSTQLYTVVIQQQKSVQMYSQTGN